MAGMRMATPLLALKQGYSAMAVGALLALFALTQVFLALPAGRYADRHGLKKPLRISVVVACVGASLSALWPIFPVMCLSALATGGATGMAVIALQRHVGRMAHNPAELRVAFSWLSIGPAISNFLGPVLAGLLIDFAGPEAAHIHGFQWAFLLMALLPLGTWFWVRLAKELHAPKALDNAAPRRALDLLAEPMMRRLLGVNWLLSSCWDVHTFVVPLLGHERGLSASVIGSILGAFAVGLYLEGQPFSPAKLKLINWHKWAGVTILALSVLRLLWRVTHRPPALPAAIQAAMPRWQHLAHHGTHHLMYLLFFAVPLIGWAYSSAAGFPIVLFGVLPLPDFVPVSPELAEFIKPWHELSAVAMLLLAGKDALAQGMKADTAKDVGILVPADSEELHDRPLIVDVIQELNPMSGQQTNRIKGYSQATSTPAPKAKPAAPSGFATGKVAPAAPWAARK